MGELRVTGGALKGRTILVPARGDARYTSSKVRGAIFNLIGDVANYNVLDLFAGSGSLTIEALSRGARRAVCVEKSRFMAGVLKENLRSLGVDKDCVVLNMDVIYALPALSKRGDAFDLILMDPPYDMGYVAATLDLLRRQTLWRDRSLLVIEHSKREQLPGLAGLWEARSRLYGDTAVSLIRCGAKER